MSLTESVGLPSGSMSRSRRPAATARTRSPSAKVASPAWTTSRLSSPRSARAVRIDFVAAGAVVRFTSKPRRREPRTISIFSSAPWCVAQKNFLGGGA